VSPTRRLAERCPDYAVRLMSCSCRTPVPDHSEVEPLKMLGLEQVEPVCANTGIRWTLTSAHASIAAQELPDGWEWEWLVQEDGLTGEVVPMLPADEGSVAAWAVMAGQASHVPSRSPVPADRW
jgi:hypothetical protein